VIETRHRRLHVASDGEVTVMDTPLEYRIRARALRVITPHAGQTQP
jgi:diacylglycerol kinase family enzyme